MKNTVILLISIATFIACTKQKAEQVSTIDSTLQVSVDLSCKTSYPNLMLR